jgi:adenylate cyclase
MSTSIASGMPDYASERRKLVAVIYADMAGYSRLIGLDDAGTLNRLRALRRDLIDPAIEEHGGRIVQTGGDSLLVVFDSIDGAVRCAVKVQQQVSMHDESASPDHAIRFRMGIDIGDAIADGTDLHGDGVIVAARLQAECPAGSICVSRAVRDHVHDRLDLSFESLGLLNLKNIARPVDAFLVRPRAMPKSIDRTLVDGAGKALPLPDKPSIAVLAFTNMNGDPEQEYFSDGIADDIITELSRSRSLFVIARNSSFTYKGRAVDVRQVARELGVRYVLEGSVRRGAARVRVATQLIEAATGKHIWAERYDRTVEDVFVVQDEITTAVSRAIGPAIAQVEQQRAIRKLPENFDAWEAYQRAMWHQTKGGATDQEQTRHFLQRAILLDPLFAAAHAALAFAHCNASNFGSFTIRDALLAAEPEARRAVDLDPDEPGALAALAWVAYGSADHDGAIELAERAIAIDANYAGAYLVKGAALAYSNRSSEARGAVLTALRLSPRDPLGAIMRLVLTVVHYFSGDYADALAIARSTVRDYPDYPLPYRYLAASLGQLGRIDEARIALEQAMTISPVAFDLHVRPRPPWFRREDHEHMLEGLRKAGWQG